MANSLLTPQDITREALRILHNKLTFIRNINRQYDKNFAKTGAKIGSQLRIRLPNEYTVRTGRVANPQSTQETNETLTVATQKGVDMTFYSDELTLSMDDFSKRIIEPGMAVLAADIEADALTMVKDIPNAVGTPGTTPATITTILNAGRKLNENLAPTPRNLLVNDAAQVSMVNALSGLFHSGKEVANQYVDGAVRNALGFDWYTSPLVPVLTTGSRDNTTPTTLTTGDAQQGSSLSCVAFDSTATIKKGDVFTIAGVYEVHPETKTAYDYLKQFTVTADATCIAGAVTLSISPAIIASGAKQNVDAAPATSAALVFAGTASTNYPMNIAFHPDAFTFVTADLEVPKGVDMAHRETYDGISMRFIRDYLTKEDEWISRLDVLYGYKTIRKQLACRVWG